MTRREMLQRTGLGFGSAALGGLVMRIGTDKLISGSDIKFIGARIVIIDGLIGNC